MKEEMSIDELLNSFVDGELTIRQETEVRRLIENDPQIAKRVQQLQRCKLLMSSLPATKAPVGMLDDIKASMESQGQQDGLFISQKRKETRYLLSRRIVAVAAMIGLAVVLTGVIFTITPPETTPIESQGTESSSSALAAAGFSGRLEMKTTDIAVKNFIKRTFEDNGFTDLLTQTRGSNRDIYIVNCSQKGLERLLADLNNIWDKLDSVTLRVETEEFNQHIIVKAVTTEQIGKIAGQQSADRSIEVAKDIAVLNNMAESLPGREIYSVIEVSTDGLITIPKPVLTGPEDSTGRLPSQSEDPKTVHLTITVSR